MQGTYLQANRAVGEHSVWGGSPIKDQINKKDFNFLFILCACVYLGLYGHTGAHRGQKSVSDPPELELHAGSSWHMEVRNRTPEPFLHP